MERFTDEQILEWKKEYGKIYQTIVDDEPYVWRKLKRKEYSMLMNDDEDEKADKVFERQEEIANLVVIFPEDIETRIQESAGLATTIAAEVLDKSGFVAEETTEL